MITRRRCLRTGVLACCLAAGSPGAPAPPPASDPALVAALEAEITALSTITWVPTTSASVSLGWRDNVLLSPFAPLSRALGRGEVEAILFRPRRHDWEFTAFLNGDVLRYFDPPEEISGEQQWVAHTEARWDPIEPLRLTLKAVGYWQDSVIDLSETEAERVVAPTRLRGGYLSAAPRLTLPAGFRLEPLVQFKRNDYHDYTGDYDESKAGVRLEWSRSPALVLSAAGSELRRDYAERTNYTAGGRPLPGTQLHFRQRDGGLRARATWQRGGEWTVAASAGRLENRDEASGYFDYTQTRGGLDLTWKRGAWRAMASADVRQTDYRTQTVGAGIAPPARRDDDISTLVRVERRLNPRWTVFAEYHGERSRSNQEEFNYHVNTCEAGTRYDF